MRGFLLAMAACFATQAAAGGMAARCDMMLECLEAEPCAETRFPFAVEQGGVTEFALVSDAGTVPGSGRQPETGGLLFHAEEAGAVHLLSVAQDGAARYSVHLMEGPMAITYHGHCGGFR